jgi:hypothetical protein
VRGQQKITPDQLGDLALVDGLRTVEATTIRNGRGSFFVDD